jgi:predicted acetyltransferase
MNQGMPSAYPIRPISEAEFPAFYAVLEHAFNATYPTDVELRHDQPIFEFDRTLAAFDGASLVGTATTLTFQMSVPGGCTPVAGVTAVSVLPSHRRRGILSSLMHRQLADIRDRGEAVAALFASEAGIYGRYGYGVATGELDLTIRRGEGLLSAPPAMPTATPTGMATATPTGMATGAPAVAGQARADGGLRLRIAEPRDATAELAKVFACVLDSRPGLPARDDRWWDFILWDPEHRRSGSSPLRCVIAEDDAGPRGYALFSAKPEWDDHGSPCGVLQVRELMATDPVAHAAVWNDLLSRDLVGEIRAPARPVDEPLLFQLADRRRARPRIVDGLWIRLVSVPDALTQRRYSCAVDVVIEVADDLLPENAGRWRLRAPGPEGAGPGGGGPGGGGAGGAAGPAASQRATCERTSAAADVILPVQSLGATYLGGTRLGALAGAGLAEQVRPGALAALSAALSWDPAPWCPTGF